MLPYRTFLPLLFLLVVTTSAHDKRFASIEHKNIGNTGTIRWLTNDGNNNLAYTNNSVTETTFTNNQGLSLRTYGDMVTTAADFFGATGEDTVICASSDPGARFNSVFQLLWDTNDSAFLDRIFKEYDTEAAALANNPNLSPYDALQTIDSSRWDTIYPSRTGYLNLVLYNFDHFNDCATQAYTVGHNLALSTAAGTSTIIGNDFDASSPEERASRITRASRQLEVAYAMNAYADHFLTDKFSAGHVRTPRREISATCADRGETFTNAGTTDLGAAGLAAMWMHDEDNRNGLLASNRRGDTYVTYGDYDFYDPLNQAGKYVFEAVQISRDEVFNAYMTGDTAALGALNLTPERSLSTQYAENNTCPLFRVAADNSMQIRRTGDIRPAAWYTTRGATGGCTYDTFVEDSCRDILKGSALALLTQKFGSLAQPTPGELSFSNKDSAWVTSRPGVDVRTSASHTITPLFTLLIVVLLVVM